MSARAKNQTTVFPLERWCSGAEFDNPIAGLPAAKRIARVKSKELRKILWFVQRRSLEKSGLRELADELGREFPERIGTPAMRRIITSVEQRLTPDQVRQIRVEMDYADGDFRVRGDETEVREMEEALYGRVYSDPHFPAHLSAGEFLGHCWKQSDGLPQYLAQMCIDPEVQIEGDDSGVWYFTGLMEALCELQKRDAIRAGEQVAETDVSAMIRDGLDFCLARRRWILIEGLSGVGKSHAVKAWCAAHAGEARYVEVPSSNDDKSFFLAIADACGVARGLSNDLQGIKLRVEEVLKESGLFLVLDEAHFLWPQYAGPHGVPSRLQWLKTAFDAGTPIAMVGLPDFSKWQAMYVKKTMYSDEQLERRLNRKIRLPSVQSKEDFMRIAEAHFPEGTRNSWRLLAGCALTSVKKQASAIVEALESAQFRAEQDGRELVTFDDLEAVIREIHMPSDHDYEAAPALPADAPQGACTPSARALHAAGSADAEDEEDFDSDSPAEGFRDEMPGPLATRVSQVGLVA